MASTRRYTSSSGQSMRTSRGTSWTCFVSVVHGEAVQAVGCVESAHIRRSKPLHEEPDFKRWFRPGVCTPTPRCINRQHRPPAREGHKPILSRGFGVRGQVDLIDLQSSADGKYKWLLVYVDHGIKLCDVRPLTSKRVRATPNLACSSCKPFHPDG